MIIHIHYVMGRVLYENKSSKECELLDFRPNASNVYNVYVRTNITKGLKP